MPPNILLITTDQQRFDHLGQAKTPGIQTPHLDRLAQAGVWLRRAYCPSPICTPSRVSLLTGRFPSSHGAYSIGVTADPFPGPTLPQLLAARGYATAIVGKTHFVARPDELAHVRGMSGATDADYRGWSGPYLGFEHVRASVGHTINSIPTMHYREFLEDAGVDYKPWFPQLAPGYTNQVAGAWNIPASYHDTQWVTDECLRWLEQPREKPWFLWASYQDPHEPFVCPEPWFSQVDPDVLNVLPGPPDHQFADRPAFYREVLEKESAGWGAIDDGHGVPCIFRWPKMDAQARTALQATAGMVRFLDDRIGALLTYLKQHGQLKNTLILFTSDHGEMHGHHGYWGKGLMAFEDCQRVPLIIAGAGVERRGASDALVNLVDLPSTILAASGAAVPAAWQGVDLLPFLRNECDQVHQETFIECMATDRIAQITQVREREKWVWYSDRPDGEVYDLQNDSDQLNNRFADYADSEEWKQFASLASARVHEWLTNAIPRKAFA